MVCADKQRLLGGILVGDASAYGQLLPICQNGVTLPPHPEDLILPADRVGGGAPAGLGVDALPAQAIICSCHNVSKGAICEAITSGKLTAVGGIKSCTKAGTGCGSCVTLLNDILKCELKKAGVVVVNHLCEHFAFTRQELFHLVKLHRLRTFDDVLDRTRHGPGLRDLQAGGGLDPGLHLERATSWTASTSACRTPTIASWPTCSATAPTRSCRGCRAARSPPTS